MLREIKQSIKLVFANRNYKFISVVSALSIAFLYVNASQLITFFPDGIYFEFSLIKIFTIIVISILFGLVMPMQIFNLKGAFFRIKETGTTFSGVVGGVLGMSCCAPVFPSLLILLGFSGTQLLALNTKLQQYILPFSLFSILLLVVSLYMLSKNVIAICKIPKYKVIK